MKIIYNSLTVNGFQSYKDISFTLGNICFSIEVRVYFYKYLTRFL